MPEQDLRLVVLGARRVHSNYDKFTGERSGAKVAVRVMKRELERTRRAIIEANNQTKRIKSGPRG